MKSLINKWVYSFAITNIIFIFITYVISERLNIEMPFLKICLGAARISILTSLSIMIFKIKQGNNLLKIVFGFIILLPTPFILRDLFGVIIFRFSFVIYLFALLCALIYTIAVVFVIAKAKKEEQFLNSLLSKNKDKN